jgi:hypothetical protein
MENKDDKKHRELLEKYPKLGATMPKVVWDTILRADEQTVDRLSDLWTSNVKENLKRNLPKCGWINDGYLDIGRYKAAIAVGSGPSLAKNKSYLKMVSLSDGSRDFKEQDFIVMVPNHSLKSCFDAGIIPHFAMVSDGSPDLAKQMDVGKSGRHTTLIANIITSPDVIKNWKGPVKLLCPKSDIVKALVKECLGEELEEEACVTTGGNIMNLSFSLSMGLFRTSVWMCVGNDLSYPPAVSLEDRRKGYYEDGDYSTNIKSKRDEAKGEFVWGGFKLKDNTIWTPKNHISWEGEWLYTASQLFMYKSWLETNATLLWDAGNQFHVYNCTEGGILGMLLNEDAIPPEKYDEKFDPANWYLMDEISRGRWRTRTLWHACEEFHEAKEKLFGRDKWKGPMVYPAAQYATSSGQNTTH